MVFMVVGKTVAKMKVGLEPDSPEVGVGIREVITGINCGDGGFVEVIDGGGRRC